MKVAEFIASMRREAEPQVQRIEIVNAKEVGTAEKVLVIKRDDTGKMTGAISTPMN